MSLSEYESQTQLNLINQIEFDCILYFTHDSISSIANSFLWVLKYNKESLAVLFCIIWCINKILFECEPLPLFFVVFITGNKNVTNFTKRTHLPDSLNTISGHFEELEDLSVLFHRYPPRFQFALQSTNCLQVSNSPEMKNKTNKRERAAKSS